MRVEMVNPQGQLLLELNCSGISQESVALTYAFIIRQEGNKADWRKINAAIRLKWKSRGALDRIKKRAWHYIDQKEN